MFKRMYVPRAYKAYSDYKYSLLIEQDVEWL